ncbi:PmoA family protein [Streptomyces sp. NBC_01619]|nr:PmoA family protein [Streptomyces sp. NBC_01619]
MQQALSRHARSRFAYRYRVVIADGAWDRDRVTSHLEGLTW